MKKLSLLCAIGFGAAAACAQEVGQVLSAVPVIQQVAVPRQVCNPQAMAVEQPHSTTGAGGVMGAIAGGAIGSQIGSGSGRAAATMLGVIGGALVGNSVEGGNRPAPQAIAGNCTTQTFTENRTVGYNVTYEYAGKQYTVQMPHDPGPTVRLQVTPVGATSAAPATSPVPMATPYVAAMPQVIMPAVVPTYYYRPAYYYPPVSLSIGYHWHHGHRHHRHWRHRH